MARIESQRESFGRLAETCIKADAWLRARQYLVCRGLNGILNLSAWYRLSNNLSSEK